MKGKMKYFTSDLLEELESVKSRNNLMRDSTAQKELAKYSKVGRELERITEFFLIPPDKKKK